MGSSDLEMKNVRDSFPGGPELATGRILNRDSFLYLLDLEVKRARRYQNFLCLLLLRLRPLSFDNNGVELGACYRELSQLLVEEIRETDILGELSGNQLVALLPYADEMAGGHVKSRFEKTLEYYDLKGKGYEVIIHQVTYPMHGTDTMDLIKRSLETETG